MVEVQVMSHTLIAMDIQALAVKNGELYGTPSAKRVSTMWLVAFVHQIAPAVC